MTSTRLIAREHELGALEETFDEGARVVTIRGPAGIGKTSFAREFAVRPTVLARFRSSVFCDLSSSRSIEDVCRTVGAALDIPLERDASAERIARRLGSVLALRGRTLVVFDNAEEAAAAAAEVLAWWADEVPSASFLVTSRENLRIGAEVVVELAPLAAPPADERAPDRIREFAAVRLFLQVAASAGAALEATDEQVHAIAELVRMLDGLPLAIELAAAQAELLSPAQLVSRLEQRFDVLVSDRRDACSRHRSLRDALDVSWRLLGPWEADALAQCTVFRGGFTPSAAEAVIDLSEHAAAPPVLQVLRSLRSRSMLRREATERGATRFSMYESVREYVQLVAGAPGDAVRARHAAYFVGAPPDEQRREAPNLAAALEWAATERPVTAERAELALRAALALHAGVRDQGSLAWECEALDTALGLAPQLAGAPALEAEARVARAGALRSRGMWERGMADYRRALELAEDAGEAALAADVRCGLAHVLGEAGFAGEAREHAEAALQSAQNRGDARAEALARMELAGLAWLGAEHDEARRAYLDLAALARRLGDAELEARALGNACGVLIEAGETQGVIDLAERALAACRRTGNRRYVAGLQLNLGFFHLVDRPQTARGHIEQAAKLSREMDDALHEGLALGALGLLRQLEHGAHAGLTELDEAVTRLAGTESPWAEATTVAARGAALAGLERLSEAQEAFAAAEILRPRVKDGASHAALELWAGHLDLALGRVSEARARLAVDHGGFERRVEVRCARAILANAVEHGHLASLVVSRDGAWFRLPQGDGVDLSRRRALRSILSALVERHLAAADPASIDELIDQGWPDERVDRAAGASRVHVAIGTLRKLGLRHVLLHDARGYRLDSGVRIIVRGRHGGTGPAD